MAHTAHFTVTEHVVPASHIREYAGATSTTQNEVLYLHLKQYTPSDGSGTVDGAVTLIATHGVGFPKELYEPLWDDLYVQSKSHGFSIRGIWIADAANLGQSGVLNEQKISNDVSWTDHARDLLLLINHFRAEMPQPLVGIGHSYGGNQITNLAYLHPRLLSSVILLDPVIQLTLPPMGVAGSPPGGVNFTTHRKDIWPNRSAAAASLVKGSKGWDPRVVERMVKYGYRDLPTAIYPTLPTDTDTDPSNPPVTLTTTKHQDAITQLRANFTSRTPDGRNQPNRDIHPDLDPLRDVLPLYRSEPPSTFYKLPTLRPSLLWVIGKRSYLSIDEMREGIKIAGTGLGGSGGMREGRVREAAIAKGHMFPFEAVEETAKTCAGWLGEELRRFAEKQTAWNEERAKMSKRDHLVLSEKWMEVVKPMSAFKNKL